MLVKVTTTITTLVDVDTFTPEHSIEVEAEDGLPREVILAVVEGACRSTLNSLGKGAVTT